jgi:hypothetical protein
MRGILRFLDKVRSTEVHGMDQEGPRAQAARCPDLAAIAEIAERRRLEDERSLDAAFEKARSILEREMPTEIPIQSPELPADVEARVRAMPDPEQRIRAIVEFKLSNRDKSGHRN